MTQLEKLTLRQLKTQLELRAGQPWAPFTYTASLSDVVDQWRDGDKERWEKLLTEGKRLRQEPIPHLLYSDFIRFAQDGNRSTYEGHYFSRRRRLAVYAMLYLASKDKMWLQALEDIIWVLCDEYTWVLPAHVGLFVNDYPEGIWDQPQPPRESIDLFAGETAFMLAEVVHLLREELQPWIVHRVREETERRIFNVFYQDPRPQNWELKTNNWPSVCASSIGAAAIYWEQDPEKLAGMLWRVVEVLRRFLSGFDEQGATAEGVAYWQFGFGMFVCFAELLKQRTGGEVDLLQGERISAIARFPEASLLVNRKTVNFSDAAEEPALQMGLFHRLMQRFPEISYPLGEFAAKDAYGNWIWLIRDMVWNEEKNNENADLKPAVQHYYFKGHQWVITKHTTEKGLTAWAAKGGHNAEPHNHNDIGHFIVHAQGENVFMDLGAGVYTRQYFQPATRYEQFTAGSHGHSVPIIDRVRQGFGEAYQAEVMAYTVEKDVVNYQLDLTAVYPCEHLTNLVRAFTWSGEDNTGGYSLQIVDVAEFTREPSLYEEVFIVSKEPRESGIGRLELGPAVRMQFNAQNWSWSAEKQTLIDAGRNERTYWRLILTCLQPSRRIEAKFSIEVD